MTTFIGPKPADVPEYPAPFSVEGRRVRDANGRFAFEVDGPASIDHYRKFAAVITEALNEKFGARPETTEAPEPAPAKLRTCIGWRDNGSFVERERAYEVRPGRFVWAYSREDAEGAGYSWGLPNVGYRLVDVETGAEVTE
ncbi:hypothetical protein [Amycolatopsis sp. NPDC003731]